MNQRNVFEVVLGGWLYLIADVAFADSGLFLAFTPDPARATVVISPEGCYVEPGEPRGQLATTEAGSVCHSGSIGPASAGAFTGEAEVHLLPAAEFTSAPLSKSLMLGSRATLRVYYANEAQTAGCADACTGSLSYALDELLANGETVALADGTAIENLVVGDGDLGCCSGRSVTLEIGTHRLAAGSQLRMRLRLVADGANGAASKGSLLFGGNSLVGGSPTSGSYGDAGMTFTIVDADPTPPSVPSPVTTPSPAPATQPQPASPPPVSSSIESSRESRGSGGAISPVVVLVLMLSMLRRHLGPSQKARRRN